MKCAKKEGCNLFFEGKCQSLCGHDEKVFVDLVWKDAQEKARIGLNSVPKSGNSPNVVEVSPPLALVPSVNPPSDYGKPTTQAVEETRSQEWDDMTDAMQTENLEMRLQVLKAKLLKKERIRSTHDKLVGNTGDKTNKYVAPQTSATVDQLAPKDYVAPKHKYPKAYVAPTHVAPTYVAPEPRNLTAGIRTRRNYMSGGA
jgi:hypothetical protein